MGSVLTKGKFAHVVGTFDYGRMTGTIDYVTPVELAALPNQSDDPRLRLIGEDAAGAVVFEARVTPQHNSCAPRADNGTFDEFIPISSGLTTIKLLLGKTVAAQYQRGQVSGTIPIALADMGASTPHKMLITSKARATPGITYSVQAKPDSASTWMTLAVGLDVPTSEVNINQFPGANSIEVRVLQTDGFSETEVLHETKHF